MACVNRAMLVGRLGRDPEVRYVSSGAPVATFSVATEESFKSRNGEQQQHTEWHKVVAWGKLAKICGEYLTKGKLVYIEGSIRSRQWEDQSGNKRTAYEIIARNMQLLGSRSDAERAAATPAQDTKERVDTGPEPSQHGEITDDDIPF
ncbi:MAG TPA: single-stranded DNA-binding protein [Terriglobia bacterium]|nr:single-stranded DNA-binding protein [Terriglobia bacterium]